MFILWKQNQNTDLTTKNLELEIENWIRSKTKTDITFNSDQSIEFLRQLGNWFVLIEINQSPFFSIQVFFYPKIQHDQVVYK